jgi:hypothetical protein
LRIQQPLTNISTSQAPSSIPSLSVSPSISTSPSFDPSFEPSLAPSQSCLPNVKKVKIQATTGKNIQIFEISVFSSESNVALRKTATQSSDWDPRFGASNAVDGKMYTFTHTKDSSAWLQIDLEDVFSVDLLIVKNRWCRSVDDPKNCLCRLSDANILLIDETDTVISSITTGNTCGQGTLEFAFDLAPEFCSGHQSRSLAAPVPSPPSNRELWHERQLAKRPSNC